MFTKKRIWLVAAILCLGIAGVFLVPTPREFMIGYWRSEPFHNGKPVNHWVSQAQYKKNFTMNSHDDGSRERREAFDALVAIGPPSVPSLCKMVQSNEHLAVRMEAAQSLGRIGPAARAAVPVLIAQLKNPNQNLNTKHDIVLALGQIDREQAFPAFVDCLQSNDTIIRMIAAKELGQIRGTQLAQALTVLNDAQKDETDETVKKAIGNAIRALEKSKKP